MQGGREQDEDVQAGVHECELRDHLQSTSRMALTVLESSLASWASEAEVQGLFL